MLPQIQSIGWNSGSSVNAWSAESPVQISWGRQDAQIEAGHEIEVKSRCESHKKKLTKPKVDR
jgi:hypothetical protein